LGFNGKGRVGVEWDSVMQVRFQ